MINIIYFPIVYWDYLSMSLSYVINFLFQLCTILQIIEYFMCPIMQPTQTQYYCRCSSSLGTKTFRFYLEKPRYHGGMLSRNEKKWREKRGSCNLYVYWTEINISPSVSVITLRCHLNIWKVKRLRIVKNDWYLRIFESLNLLSTFI
jgi:hypothetical protein